MQGTSGGLEGMKPYPRKNPVHHFCMGKRDTSCDVSELLELNGFVALVSAWCVALLTDCKLIGCVALVTDWVCGLGKRKLIGCVALVTD